MEQINSKLRVVTRRDIGVPYGAVQAGHAAVDFQHQHPSDAKTWHKNSNYLVFLTVANEKELISLISKAILKGIKHTIFREPDLNNQITGVAFEPTELSRKLTSSLPLLGKEVSYV